VTSPYLTAPALSKKKSVSPAKASKDKKPAPIVSPPKTSASAPSKKKSVSPAKVSKDKKPVKAS